MWTILGKTLTLDTQLTCTYFLKNHVLAAKHLYYEPEGEYNFKFYMYVNQENFHFQISRGIEFNASSHNLFLC